MVWNDGNKNGGRNYVNGFLHLYCCYCHGIRYVSVWLKELRFEVFTRCLKASFIASINIRYVEALILCNSDLMIFSVQLVFCIYVLIEL
jgi:hypothetical protein